MLFHQATNYCRYSDVFHLALRNVVAFFRETASPSTFNLFSGSTAVHFGLSPHLPVITLASLVIDLRRLGSPCPTVPSLKHSSKNALALKSMILNTSLKTEILPLVVYIPFLIRLLYWQEPYIYDHHPAKPYCSPLSQCVNCVDSSLAPLSNWQAGRSSLVLSPSVFQC